MLIQFQEKFSLPVEKVFPYFRDPSSWVKLYGELAPVKVDSEGWARIAIKKFPLPLVAKNVYLKENEKVRWIFGGFWRGVAEIEFKADSTGGSRQLSVEGFEYIVPHGLWLAENWVSERFMQQEFERIWSLGWKRLRKLENSDGE